MSYFNQGTTFIFTALFLWSTRFSEEKWKWKKKYGLGSPSFSVWNFSTYLTLPSFRTYVAMSVSLIMLI